MSLAYRVEIWSKAERTWLVARTLVVKRPANLVERRGTHAQARDEARALRRARGFKYRVVRVEHTVTEVYS